MIVLIYSVVTDLALKKNTEVLSMVTKRECGK